VERDFAATLRWLGCVLPVVWLVDRIDVWPSPE
jgi:hypothetical protein